MSKVRDFAEIISAGIAADDAGLGNVTNESKATMFTSPTFTGTPVAPILKLTPTATASAPAGVAGAIYYDSDEDGLGAGDESLFCDALVPEGWVTNNNDTEPTCSTNNTDDCGLCAGSCNTEPASEGKCEDNTDNYVLDSKCVGGLDDGIDCEFDWDCRNLYQYLQKSKNFSLNQSN